MADCIPCHFEFEEKHCVPHLPKLVAEWLLADHRRLEKLGYPADQILEHAEREMFYFRLHGVPEEILAQIEADHEKIVAEINAAAASA